MLTQEYVIAGEDGREDEEKKKKNYSAAGGSFFLSEKFQEKKSEAGRKALRLPNVAKPRH